MRNAYGSLKFKGQGLPPSGNYQVFKITQKKDGLTIGYVTIYYDTKKVQYEFDNEVLYDDKVLLDLVRFGMIESKRSKR